MEPILNLQDSDNEKETNINNNNKNDDSLNRNMFSFDFVIGKGGFGKVWHVSYKKTKESYALKEMSKRKIIDKKSEKSINSEREFLSILNHPFIVNMHYAFQDKDNLYLVMDVLSGGDLRYHCSRYRTFSEEQTRFFIACMIYSLSYIHENNVIHRDIKPENLVLDDKGYVRITDFGVAKENMPDNSSETSGTPGYMAPEVMRAKNHSFPVDFFAIGIIGYEFMIGKRPYNGRNRKEIKEQMFNKQAKISEEDIKQGWSPESVDFINKLLERKPELRLGGNNGASELMSHPWLKYYPWEELKNKKLPAPFIPENKDNFDKRYCESIDKISEDTRERYEEIYKSTEYKEAFKNFYFNKEEVRKIQRKLNKSKVIKNNKSLIKVNCNNNNNNNNLSTPNNATSNLNLEDNNIKININNNELIKTKSNNFDKINKNINEINALSQEYKKISINSANNNKIKNKIKSKEKEKNELLPKQIEQFKKISRKNENSIINVQFPKTVIIDGSHNTYNTSEEINKNLNHKIIKKEINKKLNCTYNTNRRNYFGNNSSILKNAQNKINNFLNNANINNNNNNNGKLNPYNTIGLSSNFTKLDNNNNNNKSKEILKHNLSHKKMPSFYFQNMSLINNNNNNNNIKNKIFYNNFKKVNNQKIKIKELFRQNQTRSVSVFVAKNINSDINNNNNNNKYFNLGNSTNYNNQVKKAMQKRKFFKNYNFKKVPRANSANEVNINKTQEQNNKERFKSNFYSNNNNNSNFIGIHNLNNNFKYNNIH